MTTKSIEKLENIDITTLQEQIITLKKEIILMKIKNTTKQNIKTHVIKNKQHQLAQMLTLETLKLNK